jgi:hypothetical protein
MPASVGEKNCTIYGGGSAPGTRFLGRCRVSITMLKGLSTVTFTEFWGEAQNTPIKPGAHLYGHAWIVRLESGRAVALSETGSFPPQEWS